MSIAFALSVVCIVIAAELPPLSIVLRIHASQFTPIIDVYSHDLLPSNLLIPFDWITPSLPIIRRLTFHCWYLSSEQLDFTNKWLLRKGKWVTWLDVYVCIHTIIWSTCTSLIASYFTPLNQFSPSVLYSNLSVHSRSTPLCEWLLYSGTYFLVSHRQTPLPLYLPLHHRWQVTLIALSPSPFIGQE